MRISLRGGAHTGALFRLGRIERYVLVTQARALAMALAAILGGQFSRTGYSLRIAKAAGAFLIVRVVGYGLVAASAWNGWLNVFQYLVPIVATAIALRVLFRALKPRRRRNRRLRPAGLKARTA